MKGVRVRYDEKTGRIVEAPLPKTPVKPLPKPTRRVPVTPEPEPEPTGKLYTGLYL